MAASSRLLCTVLTFWFVVSGPSAANRPGSPDSGWWAAKESSELQKSATQQIIAGNAGAAEQIFRRGLEEAIQRHDRIAQARYLSSIANTRLIRYDYRSALETYLAARRIAEAAQDRLDLGAIDSNLSALYEQVWDRESALRASDAALADAKDLPSPPYYLARSLLESGRLHQERGDRDPFPYFERGIDLADTSQEFGVEAEGWDLLGQALDARGENEAAETAFIRAYYLRRLQFPRDLGRSYFWLGSARLAEAESLGPGPARVKALEEAGRLTRIALAANAGGQTGLSPFLLHQQQGRILLVKNDLRGALGELSAAVGALDPWRQRIPAALTSLAGAASELEARVVSALVEAAADYGLRSGHSEWAEKSFLVQEANRAANFVTGQTFAQAWRRRMPERFLEVLGELRAEEARLRRGNRTESPATNRLKLELTEMEAEYSREFSAYSPENFRTHNSLIHFQLGIAENELYVSFKLGERGSLVWAVTREGLSVYRVPERSKIRQMVREFRAAVEEGRAEGGGSGRTLYTMLFGQLSRAEAEKPNWLISPDDTLLQLPFAALSPEEGVYLAERHTVEISPGFFLRAHTQAGAGVRRRFLGVGDPIYNRADSRLAHGFVWSWTARDAAGQLNRLPGSGREVERGARAWPDAVVLEGEQARKDRFFESIRTRRPDVIHLATHVVGTASEPLLAFGIGKRPEPELLGTAEIALLNVAGSLVLMTGCSSAIGDPRTGVGLENLARAWLLAGAEAVIATEWPVDDSGGGLLEAFYANLQAAGPAEALRRSQVQMIHSGGPDAAPRQWGAYQVFGGAL